MIGIAIEYLIAGVLLGFLLTIGTCASIIVAVIDRYRAMLLDEKKLSDAAYYAFLAIERGDEKDRADATKDLAAAVKAAVKTRKKWFVPEKT